MKFLEEMKEIQENVLTFLEDENTANQSFQSLIKLFEDFEIYNNQHNLMAVLHLLLKIANNHHHGPNFFDKIERILLNLKSDIQKYFSNSAIFNTFKSNKRILLFLFEEKIIIMNKYIVKKFLTEKFIKAKYPQYFSPEIRPFIDKRWFPQICQGKKEAAGMFQELPEGFFEKRKMAENESFICQLIRKDSVDEFESFVSKNNYSLESTINPSIYETNNFLVKISNSQKIDLICYAAFHGSIHIFQYLLNKVPLYTTFLWLCVIHGQNAEIFNLLENKSKVSSIEYDDCFKESIKCHHNEMANFIKDKASSAFIQALKYYNYTFISNEQINESSFFNICKYDHYLLAEFILQNQNVDINKVTF